VPPISQTASGSTAVLEYRPTETLPLLGAMLLDLARLCRRCRQHGRQNGGKPASFLRRRRNPVRDGLSAGGKWIRASASAREIGPCGAGWPSSSSRGCWRVRRRIHYRSASRPSMACARHEPFRARSARGRGRGVRLSLSAVPRHQPGAHRDRWRQCRWRTGRCGDASDPRGRISAAGLWLVPFRSTTQRERTKTLRNSAGKSNFSRSMAALSPTNTVST